MDEFASKSQNMPFVSEDQGQERKKTQRFVPLILDSETLSSSPRNLARELTEEMRLNARMQPEIQDEEFRGKLRKILKTGADVAGALKKNPTAVYDILDGFRGLTDESSLSQCIRAYSQLLWPKNRVIGIFVDEMQICEDTTHLRNNLKSLHLGKLPCPMMLACFGLPGLIGHLRNLGSRDGQPKGLSRFARGSIRSIGTFPQEDWGLAVEMQLQELGMLPNSCGTSADRSEWLAFAKDRGFTEEAADSWAKTAANGIAERSQGFPQHIFTGVHALCKTLADNSHDFSPENPLHGAACEKHEDARQDYYGELMGDPILRDYAVGLGAICLLCAKSNEGGVAKHKAESILAQGHSLDGARSALKRACAKGVLSLDEEKPLLIMPPVIPTLSGYLQEQFSCALNLSSPDPTAIAIQEIHGVAPRPAGNEANSLEIDADCQHRF